MKKSLLLLVPMMYLVIFDSAYGWKQTQAYYPRVNPYYYAVPNQYRSYQSKPSRYNPYTQNNFPAMNRFMRPPSMGFGSPFSPMSSMGMSPFSPMSGMGMSPMSSMSPMGFGSPFSPMSGMGMSPMSAMSPMSFGSPFSPMSGMGMSSMSPMGFGSPFSPMSSMGMSPMKSMSPMGFGSPFGSSMPFQMMPWGNRRNY